jgi:PAS domain S-box-containing protein
LLLERIAASVSADRATLSRIDGDWAVIEGSYDGNGPGIEPGARWRITSTQFRGWLADGKPVLQAYDVTTLPSPFREQLADVRHMATVPLRFADDVLGTIVVSRRQDSPFDARDLAILQELSNLAVLALQNSMLADRARRSDSDLRTSEERFHLLVDSVKDYAIFMLDPHGRVTSWNQGAARIKGYRAEEVIGRHFSIFYPAEAIAAGEPARGLALAVDEGRFAAEGWRVRKDGSLFWASVVITALRDDDGRLRGFAKVTRDITERKRMQDQLLDAERREVARLRELAEQAASLERTKSEFLKLASHELRTPVSVIGGYLSLFADGDLGPLTERGQRAVSAMKNQASELTLLIGQMLEAARMEQGKVALALENLDLRDVAAQALKWAQGMARENHHLQASLPAEPIPVRADRARLVTILKSLLENALKYSPTGGPILLQIVSDRSQAQVKVTDRGLGIRKDQLERLFRPFGRLVTDETADIDGAGLGLYVAGELARAQGGEITVQSEPGRGSTFTLSLPVRSPLATEAQRVV